MSRYFRRVVTAVFGCVVGVASGPALGTVVASNSENGLSTINHIVVIYEENHSFDNLYGGWEGVNGLGTATSANTTQVGQGGAAYTCLLQKDVNLASPPLPADCTDSTTSTTFSSHFANQPFSIGAFIPSTATTCPQPGHEFDKANGWANGTGIAGGCTRDIVHRFYSEQYQLNNGAQNRYVTGSDAAGLTMGFYDTTTLPIYVFLHSPAHPHYAIADDFFQGAFGGSFLNHQWLIAAATPTDTNANIAALHSIIDSKGMATSTPLYHTSGTKDAQLIQACSLPTTNPNFGCGDQAVNTIQPPYQPTSSNPVKLSPQTGKTIGDELTAGGVSWAWYSGGWSNADGDIGAPGWTNGSAASGTCADPNSFANPAFPFCPNKVFQFHHQPFNYFANYAPKTPGRAHLQDEQAFIDLASGSSDTCKLNQVSFIKPIGLENEHPGYTSETRGSDHLVGLLQSIEAGACRKDTMVIVTYDEFGGQWDHAAPPGQGGMAGPHDQWGPGTRVPALIVSPHLRGTFVVDHTQYDTTSILATIEEKYGLGHLSSRDAAVKSLSNVFAAISPFDD